MEPLGKCETLTQDNELHMYDVTDIFNKKRPTLLYGMDHHMIYHTEYRRFGEMYPNCWISQLGTGSCTYVRSGGYIYLGKHTKNILVYVMTRNKCSLSKDIRQNVTTDSTTTWVSCTGVASWEILIDNIYFNCNVMVYGNVYDGVKT